MYSALKELQPLKHHFQNADIIFHVTEQEIIEEEYEEVEDTYETGQHTGRGLFS